MKIIHELETFAINEDLNVDVVDIDDDHKALIIDDFYKDPDAIRKIADESYFTCSKNIIFESPVWKSEQTFDLNHICEFVSMVTEKIYGNRLGVTRVSFMINAFKVTQIPQDYFLIHNDGSIFSAVIYLNKPDECDGGTSFWRHKKTKLQAMPHFNYHNHMIPSSDRKLLEEILGEITHEKLKEMTLKEIYNSKNLDNWEMTYEVPMKYNRMVMYPASYFHSMALNLDTMFKNNWRIIQSCMFG